MDFDKKVVVVTGASLHTGYYLSRYFLEEKAIVYPVCKTEEEADKVFSELSNEYGDSVKNAVCNLSDAKSIISFFSKIDKIDVLVNNACVQGTGYNFIDVPMEQFHQVMAVNIEGMLLASQLAAKKMAVKKNGAIVNISSNTSHRAIRNRVSYIASKGGIEAATRAMAIDLSEYNIRVNAVAPGYINTSRWDVLDKKTKDIRRNNIPLGEELNYKDIFNTVKFLASDDASKITGECIVIDGGCTSQLFSKEFDL